MDPVQVSSVYLMIEYADGSVYESSVVPSLVHPVEVNLEVSSQYSLARGQVLPEWVEYRIRGGGYHGRLQTERGRVEQERSGNPPRAGSAATGPGCGHHE